MDNLTKYLKYKNLYLDLKKNIDLIGGVPGLANGYEYTDDYVQHIAHHWYNKGRRQISYSDEDQPGYYLMNHGRDDNYPYENYDTHIHILSSEDQPTVYYPDGSMQRYPEGTIGLNFSLKSYGYGINIPSDKIDQLVREIIRNKLKNRHALIHIEQFMNNEINYNGIEAMIVTGPAKNDMIIVENAQDTEGEEYATTSLNVLSHISIYMESKLADYYNNNQYR